MKELKQFFENYADIVYITEISTNKVVFLNKAGREALHLTSDDQYLGQKCYKTFYGYDLPCANCTNERLQENMFYDWSVINERLATTFLVRDTMIVENDITYRVEIATDLNTLNPSPFQTQIKMNNNERILNNVYDAAYNTTEPVKAIELSIESLGRQFDSDRMYIFEDNPDGTSSNTYEWCREGITPEIHNLQNVPASTMHVWNKHFEKGENIIIYDLEEYKPIDPEMYDTLKPQNIHSLVVGPLTIGNQRFGFYGVDNPPHDAIGNITTMYTLLGKFLASLLRDRDRAKKLRQLSYHDALTGLFNRASLHDYMKALKNQSITFFFLDLNGLKHINDYYGHHEGDLFIIRAANVLKNFFMPDPVFRMGGDEFLSIKIGLTEEEAQDMNKALRKHLVDEDISTAIGMVWKPDNSLPFNIIFKEADYQMYNDKKKYYSSRLHDRRIDRNS